MVIISHTSYPRGLYIYIYICLYTYIRLNINPTPRGQTIPPQKNNPQVPESIAFAFMAGLSPYYGMASVFWVGTLTGLFGGRCVCRGCACPLPSTYLYYTYTPHNTPNLKKIKTQHIHTPYNPQHKNTNSPVMISGAAGAMTVVMGDLTSDRGPLRRFTRAERVEQLSMCVLLIGALMAVLAPVLCAFVKVRVSLVCVWGGGVGGGDARSAAVDRSTVEFTSRIDHHTHPWRNNTPPTDHPAARAGRVHERARHHPRQGPGRGFPCLHRCTCLSVWY